MSLFISYYNMKKREGIYSKIYEFINFFVREIEYFNSSVSLLFSFSFLSSELQIIEEYHQF